MNKRIIGMALLLLVGLSAEAYTHGKALDSIYHVLDEAIANSSKYVAEKEQSIGRLRSRLQATATDAERYLLSRQLYDEYMPYMNDSALWYLQRCVGLAEGMGHKHDADECRVLMALQCSNAGMFDEAQAVLADVQPASLDSVLLGRYYEAQHHVFGELAFYSRLEPMRAQYEQRKEEYGRLMMPLLGKNSDARFVELENQLRQAGKPQEAKALNDEWLGLVEPGSHRYALTALYRYLDYKELNDTVQMMRWIAESVLADVRNAVMNQGSIWEIANQLMLKGDHERAYRYISFASDCAERFGSRVRFWQLSPLLSAIDRNYQLHNERTNRQLRYLLAAISVMALLVVLMLLYVNRQRKRLADARDKLHTSNVQLADVNGQLKAVNGQLQSVNEQLTSSNEQLSSLNAQLSEASRVKEEYVGRFLQMCSLYIDKMDKMRKTVNKKIKSHEYEELYNMTRSREQNDRELDELYENFDSAFLHLFPNFVRDFNALLKPEERIELTDPNRLNTSMRIFALIRLGIDDSSKIAEFLHYSVNTIYNYRARVKNGALVGRDDFERRVREIGG